MQCSKSTFLEVSIKRLFTLHFTVSIRELVYFVTNMFRLSFLFQMSNCNLCEGNHCMDLLLREGNTSRDPFGFHSYAPSYILYQLLAAWGTVYPAICNR